MKFTQVFRKYGFAGPIMRIVGALVALAVFMFVVAWVGNPYLKDDEGNAAPAWIAPTTVPPATSTTPVAGLPPGFPSMRRPPPMPQVAEGQPQPVPTKFGLSYTVPWEGWRASNAMVMGWNDAQGNIATYGATSDYRYGYCPEVDSASLASVAATGRNGVDLNTAAREEVVKANRIFADDTNGIAPTVEIRGPFSLEVSGRAAVRYTAVVTAIPKTDACTPKDARFDIVATPGYASAEVMLLMVEHRVGPAHALSDTDVDSIVGSLSKTEH
ncbi:hypothetical protein OG921_02660 [Aldersonia sp. NBC_00410]|uniref:hypothetical protein n=1 Tax=Aldersonia sp. NBC_00410 TaxID=2975954 RepID=UPI0022568D86|nr:hypothetical protein [Aldersonia sp. NBC_00410]MCX5042094.1 hypothetical protein [Aldersonia sp. NBC_00410]